MRDPKACWDSIVDELLIFIDGEAFKEIARDRAFPFTQDELKFLISCKRLNRFLQSIKKAYIEEANLEKLENTLSEVSAYDVNMICEAPIKDNFFMILIDIISDEISNCKKGEMKSKKILKDLEKLNVLQKKIIETYFFKSSIPDFLKKIKTKRSLIKDDRGLIFICDILADLFYYSYFERDTGDTTTTFCNFFNIKIKDNKMPPLADFTHGVLTFDDIVTLVPLLRGYAQSARDIETIASFWETREGLITLSDTLGLGIASELKRNEFHNAVKAAYLELCEHKKIKP